NIEKKADKTEVDANKAAIATNKAEIATNKTAIDANTANIATNKTAIDANTANIATNKTAIDANTANIIANKTAIATNKADIATHTQRLDNLDNRVNNLNKDLKRGLASQAALNGLFQPYNVGKLNLTAAVGGYKSQTAVAVGTGYRHNENVATKAGIAFTHGGSATYNVGVNFEW
ncbi:TPA: YadA C-terminal domain-containing protein, partial [Haemophilus influenzae]